LKEENTKLYSVFSYFFGKSIVELPYSIIYPTILSAMVYWACNLNYDEVSRYLYFLAIMLIMSFNGDGIGMLIGSLFSDPKTAISVAPMFLGPFVFFSGFLANNA